MMLRFTAAAVAALALSAGAVAAQDFNQAPTFGGLNVVTGYVPDPAVIPLIAGGDIDASRFGDGCIGMIANAPDFRVNYEAGTEYPLIISAVSDGDLTLVINDPNGAWHCNDDNTDLNPAITFASPASGQYDIWVGVYSSEPAVLPAGLYISEVMTGVDFINALMASQTQ